MVFDAHILWKAPKRADEHVEDRHARLDVDLVQKVLTDDIIKKVVSEVEKKAFELEKKS